MVIIAHRRHILVPEISLDRSSQYRTYDTIPTTTVSSFKSHYVQLLARVSEITLLD